MWIGACCGLVCGSPCGSPMWGGKFRHGLLEKSPISIFLLFSVQGERESSKTKTKTQKRQNNLDQFLSLSPKAGHNKAGRLDFWNQRFESDTAKMWKMRKAPFTLQKQGFEEIPQSKGAENAENADAKTWKMRKIREFLKALETTTAMKRREISCSFSSDCWVSDSSFHGCWRGIVVVWRLLWVPLLPLNDGQVEKSSFHGCYRLGPQEVELEHSKVIVSWLL